MRDFEINLVGEILRDSAKRYVLPRFLSLGKDEIFEKGPGNFVTIADMESEVGLTAALKKLLPESYVVGEEACHNDPKILTNIEQEALVWLVDPIDGTSNFVKGSDKFCMMVALLHHQQVWRSWIYLPVSDQLYFAERGGGAWCDGEKIVTPHHPNDGPLNGQINMSLFAQSDRKNISEMLAQDFHGIRENVRCAGVDCIQLMTGVRHYSLYKKMWPWDHAPGSLLISESGGVCQRLDGKTYRPFIREQGLLITCDQDLWQKLRDKLSGYGFAL